MATTLPTYTRTLDDAFVTTWYEIREEAIDNILSATPIWNIFMAAGCFTPQTGGEIITRTIRHGEITPEQVAKGSVMTPGEPDLETMAMWDWRYLAANVQRSTFDDQKNAGPSKIKDYVGSRITAARDGLEQKFETDIWGTHVSAEGGNAIQSINDIVPTVAQAILGTYGKIARPASYDADATDTVREPATGNVWWGPKYYTDGQYATIDVDLLDDMKRLYNAIHANQSAPNLLVATLELFEIYETFAVDISQIIKDETTRLADMGYEVLRFKGKPLVWSSNQTAKTMTMLNTDFIEVVYDPGLWFDMTDWKPQAFEFDRAAQILCAAALFTTQPRRHGMLLYD
jgi:hypothetical protein